LFEYIRLLPLHPNQKLGGEKGQKIFESLEATTFYSNIEVRFKATYN